MQVSDEPSPSNFTAFLEILSNRYAKQLGELRGSEDDAIDSFYNAYNEMLKSISGSNNLGINGNGYDFNHGDRTKERTTSKTANTVNQKASISVTAVHHSTEVPETASEENSAKCLKPHSKWVKRITIPEPFDLSCYQKKSNEFTKIGSSTTGGSTPEPVVHIRANPVPAHVHLPFFQLMREHELQVRDERLAQRRRKLLAEVKPFNLSQGQKMPPKFKSQSMINLTGQQTRADGKNCFTASPFPEHIFKSKDKALTQLDEELRQIRIKARAEEMLKQSSLPFSGPRILKRWRSFSMEKPVNKDRQDTLSSKKAYDASIFAFRNRNSYRKDDSIFMDENLTNSPKSTLSFEIKPRTTVPRSKSASHKSTRTSDLRLERAKMKTEKENFMELDLEENNALEKRDSGIRKVVISKVRINDHLLTSKDSIREKLRQNREYDKRRAKEYQEELQEMNQRVNKIPLLIDRQSMDSARRSVERKIQQGISLPVRKRFEEPLEEQSRSSSLATVDQNTESKSSLHKTTIFSQESSSDSK